MARIGSGSLSSRWGRRTALDRSRRTSGYRASWLVRIECVVGGGGRRALPGRAARIKILAGVLAALLAGSVWLAPSSSAALDLVVVIEVEDGAVGEQVLAAFAFGNNSSFPESALLVQFGEIDLYPSCFTTARPVAADCANGSVQPDDYQLVGPFTGVAVTPNATCSGNWSATEAAPGRWRFTPPLGEGALALRAGDICIVRFEAIVLQVPTGDVDERAAGTQTRNVVSTTPLAVAAPPGTFTRESASATSTVTSVPSSTTTTSAPTTSSTTSTSAPTSTTTSLPATTTTSTTTTSPPVTATTTSVPVTTTTTIAPSTTSTSVAPGTTTTVGTGPTSTSVPATTTTSRDDAVTTTTRRDVSVTTASTSVPAATTTTRAPTTTTTTPGATSTTTTTSVAGTTTTTTAPSVTTTTGPTATSTTTTTVVGTTPPTTVTIGGTVQASPAQGRPGEPLVLTGTGWRPNERLTARFNSTPVVLAVFDADASGSYSVAARVPADATAGAHTIVVTGASGRTTSTPFTVPGLPLVITPLSRTGFSLADPLTLAGLLLIVGSSAVFWARGRRTW